MSGKVYVVKIKFMLISQSLRDVDYIIKDKTLIEGILDTEFLDPLEKGLLYNGEPAVMMKSATFQLTSCHDNGKGCFCDFIKCCCMLVRRFSVD